jgi:hypothetical protein
MSERVKLTKSENALYENWTADYKNMIAQIGSIVNDNITMRLVDMGREKGLDMGEAGWEFDHKTREFYKEDEKQEVKPLVPGKGTVKTEE